MDLKKILLYIGLPLVSLGLIIGVVLVLRARNAAIPSDAIVLNASSTSATGGLTPPTIKAAPALKLTPQEQKERDAMTQIIDSAPKNIQDTWTPEFKAQVESGHPSSSTH